MAATMTVRMAAGIAIVARVQVSQRANRLLEERTIRTAQRPALLEPRPSTAESRDMGHIWTATAMAKPVSDLPFQTADLDVIRLA